MSTTIIQCILNDLAVEARCREVGKAALRRYARELIDAEITRVLSAAELAQFLGLSQRTISSLLNTPTFPEPRVKMRPRRYDLGEVMAWWRARFAETGYPRIDTEGAISLVLGVWVRQPRDQDRIIRLIADLLFERPLSLAQTAKILTKTKAAIRHLIARDLLKRYLFFGPKANQARGTLRVALAEAIIFANRRLAATPIREVPV